MSARPVCGDCPACRAITAELLGTPERADVPGPRPTVAALEKHARKYGPAMVAETAATYGLTVAVERPKARRKSGGPSLKTRVAGHVRDGHGVEAIAEIEDLSPSRARRLVEEVGE